MRRYLPWVDSATYVPRPGTRAKQSLTEFADGGNPEGYHAFRDSLDRHLANVPDDLYVESRREWRGLDGRVSTLPIPESIPRTKHIVRSRKGLVPEMGTFVADVHLHEMADAGCNVFKPETMRVGAGDSLLYLMVEGHAVIRRLLAHIDEQDVRIARLERAAQPA